MPINIQPIETDGAHWVDIDMDGRVERRSPFRDADEAEAMSRQVAAVCRALFHGGTHIHRARSGMPARRQP